MLHYDAKVLEKKPRKTRSDKGKQQPPRGGAGTRISLLSLLRFRHGGEREATEEVRAAMEQVEKTGVMPWLQGASIETQSADASGICQACVMRAIPAHTQPIPIHFYGFARA